MRALCTVFCMTAFPAAAAEAIQGSTLDWQTLLGLAQSNGDLLTVLLPVVLAAITLWAIQTMRHGL